MRVNKYLYACEDSWFIILRKEKASNAKPINNNELARFIERISGECPCKNNNVHAKLWKQRANRKYLILWKDSVFDLK